MATLLLASPAYAVGPVVISQVLFRGAGGSNDEAVELFNTTSGPINLNGWRLVGSNQTASSITTRITFGSVTIDANGFLLVANSVGSFAANADATYGAGFSDSGGVELVAPNGDVSDAVCSTACVATFCEGTGLTLPTADGATNAFARNGTGCARQDTDDNATDFTGPQAPAFLNSESSCGTCGGVSCTTPPDTCHVDVGLCTDGTCSYGIDTGSACSDGDACTTGDTCSAGGACEAGSAVVCNTPPAATCSNPTTRVTYASTGTCDSGDGCHYAPTSTTCQYGCASGACVADPCSGGSCNSPPNTACYAASGTCDAGVCHYAVSAGVACDDSYTCTENDTCGSDGICSGTIKLCKTPPPSTCEGGNLRMFSNGSCAAETGECIYAATLAYCVDGCDTATATCIGGIVGANENPNTGLNDDDSSCAAAPGELAVGLLFAALLYRQRPRVRPRSGT